MRISAIICSFNPRADYIERVLGGLQKQTLAKSEWELLVIDNGSSPPLSSMLDLRWHPQGKVVEEKTPGVAYARIKGIQEVKSDLILFIDDDNVLDENYLEECVRIGEVWPQLAVWGGSIRPEFEVEPPSHLRPHLKVLALREVAKPLWSNVRTCVETEPWGAGLCLRRSVALAYAQHFYTTNLPIKGNTGTDVFGGEDTEICYVACSQGMGMGLFPSLNLLHLIAARRLTDDYIVKIHYSYAVKSFLLAYKWGGLRPKSPFSPIQVMRILKHLLAASAINRRLALSVYRGRITATKMIASAHPFRADTPGEEARSVASLTKDV